MMDKKAMRKVKLLLATLLLNILSLTTLQAQDDQPSVNPDQQNPDPVVSAMDEPSNRCDGEKEIVPSTYNENNWYATEPQTDYEFAREHNLWGIWLPEGPPAFRPFVADPRQLTYSGGWRFNDKVLVQNVIDISLADTMPIFRWFDVGYLRGDVQIELEGGVWAVFDPLHESSPLMDADYYIGIPITYLFGDWAIRLRGYHISTHIGDEFLINHPHFHRRNPSIEVLDLYASWQFRREVRLYSGVGWLCCQDDSFRVGKIYVEAGVELRFPQLGYRDYCNRLYGEPFYGMHFHFQSHFKHHINSTYVLGYEWGKVSGLRRKLRIFVEYHDGYSVDGQFAKEPTHYVSLRGTYGF